jgi:Ca-activated chloride channel family protein
MRSRWLIPATAAAVVVVAGSSAGGPLPSAGRASAQDRPLFSSGSSLVVLHVTVKDGKGRYVNGLSKDAFAVLEDQRPQAIQLFTSQDAPVTVGLLIDSSGSMQNNRDRVVAAASAFVETSNPQDEVFALAFNEDVRAALPPDAPFTASASTLRGALLAAIAARGRTALYDAMAGGFKYLEAGQHERKVLVVVSDGGDNASRSRTFERVLGDIQASNVLVYTVGLIDPLERDANPKHLRALAQASGGEAFFPRDTSQVVGVLQQIARDIRNSYTIGYALESAPPDGAFHRVRVIVDAPGVRPLSVRTRAGYLAIASGGKGARHEP